MKEIFAVLFLSILLFISSCDHIDRKTFSIKTETGEIIELTCPVVSPLRSSLTYFISENCVIEVKR